MHSNRGDRVLIPRVGLGAAARLGRQVLAFESQPEYHRIILRRLVGHGHLLLPPPPSKEPEPPPGPRGAADPARETPAGD